MFVGPVAIRIVGVDDIECGREAPASRIAVPEDAVQVLEGRDVVFVRTQRGFQAREVEVGSRSAGMVTILSGLTAGQRIATDNAFLLKSELGKENVEDDD